MGWGGVGVEYAIGGGGQKTALVDLLGYISITVYSLQMAGTLER